MAPISAPRGLEDLQENQKRWHSTPSLAGHAIHNHSGQMLGLEKVLLGPSTHWGFNFPHAIILQVMVMLQGVLLTMTPPLHEDYIHFAIKDFPSHMPVVAQGTELGEMESSQDNSDLKDRFIAFPLKSTYVSPA
jgi:hypothetical protein